MALLEILADGILHLLEIGLDERDVIKFMVPSPHCLKLMIDS